MWCSWRGICLIDPWISTLPFLSKLCYYCLKWQHIPDRSSSVHQYGMWCLSLSTACILLEKKRPFFHGLVLTCTFTLLRCKAADVAPYAVFKSPLPYNSSHSANKHGNKTATDKISVNRNQLTTDSPVIITKSPKSDHRCRNSHRKDSMQHRGKKGKRCEKHQNVSTVQISPITKVQTTTPGLKTEHSNVSKSSTFVLNTRKARKKVSRKKETSGNATQKGQVLLNVTTKPHPQTSTTQSTWSPTQHPAPHRIRSPASSSTNKTTKSKKRGHCCGLKAPPRGDAFHPHCKNCTNQTLKSHNTTATPSTTAYRLLIKSKTLEDLQLKMTTERAKQDTLKNISSKSKFPAHKDGKTQETWKSYSIWNNSHQESVGRTKGPNTPTKRGLAGECMDVLLN